MFNNKLEQDNYYFQCVNLLTFLRELLIFKIMVLLQIKVNSVPNHFCWYWSHTNNNNAEDWGLNEEPWNRSSRNPLISMKIRFTLFPL